MCVCVCVRVCVCECEFVCVCVCVCVRACGFKDPQFVRRMVSFLANIYGPRRQTHQEKGVRPPHAYGGGPGNLMRRVNEEKRIRKLFSRAQRQSTSKNGQLGPRKLRDIFSQSAFEDAKSVARTTSTQKPLVVAGTKQARKRQRVAPRPLGFRAHLPPAKSLVGLNGRVAAGDSRESDAKHRERHPASLEDKWALTCSRCAYSKWRRSHQSAAPWLCPKPGFLSSAWGVGCSLCAAGRISPEVKQRRQDLTIQNRSQGISSQAASRYSKWSRYAVRRLFTSHDFAVARAMHEGTDLHRVCASVFMNPAGLIAPCVRETALQDLHTGRGVNVGCAAAAVAEPCGATPAACGAAFVRPHVDLGSVTDPFRGRVPQLQDWVNTWAEASSCVSFSKQDRLVKKKHLKTSSRGLGRTDIARAKQASVMAEVTREGIRARLREATSVSLALDEGQGRKVIRVRFDTPTAPYRADAVLGTYRRSYIGKAKVGEQTTVADEVTEDHALNALKHLREFLERLFTPMASRKRRRPGSACGEIRCCNEEELNAFRRKVRILAADGGSAERRAVFLAAERYFPNVSLVIRDPAHGIRIAIQKPLQLESLFKGVYDELIDNRHALIPDIQNSGKWQKILEGIQTSVLRMPCMQLDGALKVVLNHLAFAKQRMDSCADPLAKFCLMLLPMAVLLAFVASDERCSRPQRERAVALLKNFKPKFLHAAGVSADWGLICVAFLRLFDRFDHDIANSSDELDHFVETVRACFIQGHIFRRVPIVPACGGPPSRQRAMFITDRVRRQTMSNVVLRCGKEHVVIWGAICAADLRDLTESTSVAATAMLDRVRAELSGLRTDFSCFAVKRVGQACSRGGEAEVMKQRLLASVRALACAFKLDSRVVQLEYSDALPIVQSLWEAALICDETTNDRWFDNRRVWQEFLSPKFVEQHFGSRVTAMSELSKLLRIWFSVLDGEAQVERDLGQLRAFREESSRGGDALLDDLLVLKLNGPVGAEDFATETASGVKPTDLSIRCAELWRETFGQRYGIQRPQRKKRQATTGTFLDARRAVLRAAERARTASVTRRLNLAERTDYGVSAGFLVEAASKKKEDTLVFNAALKKFHSDTLRKRVRLRMDRVGRSAFPKWKPLNACAKAAEPRNYLSRIRNLAFLPTREATACGVVPSGYSEASGEHKCRSADLVIVDSLERLHSAVGELEWVTHLFHVVARGLPLTTGACVAKAGGHVRRLQVTEVVEHMPLSKIEKTEFEFPKLFHRQYPALIDAFIRCGRATGSQWRLKPMRSILATGATLAGYRQVSCSTLQDLWQWLQSERKIVNSRGAPVIWRSEQPGI